MNATIHYPNGDRYVGEIKVVHRSGADADIVAALSTAASTTISSLPPEPQHVGQSDSCRIPSDSTPSVHRPLVIPHGQGRMEYSCRRMHHPQFHSSLRCSVHPTGQQQQHLTTALPTVTTAQPRCYQGQWVNGKWHGQGELQCFNVHEGVKCHECHGGMKKEDEKNSGRNNHQQGGSDQNEDEDEDEDENGDKDGPANVLLGDRYHCAECQYDVCESCMREGFHQSHPHPLIHVQAAAYASPMHLTDGKDRFRVKYGELHIGQRYVGGMTCGYYHGKGTLTEAYTSDGENFSQLQRHAIFHYGAVYAAIPHAHSVSQDGTGEIEVESTSQLRMSMEYASTTFASSPTKASPPQPHPRSHPGQVLQCQHQRQHQHFASHADSRPRTHLYRDLWHHVFSFLSLSDLHCCLPVCKEWDRTISQSMPSLELSFDRELIIDECISNSHSRLARHIISLMTGCVLAQYGINRVTMGRLAESWPHLQQLDGYIDLTPFSNEIRRTSKPLMRFANGSYGRLDDDDGCGEEEENAWQAWPRPQHLRSIHLRIREPPSWMVAGGAEFGRLLASVIPSQMASSSSSSSSSSTSSSLPSPANLGVGFTFEWTSSDWLNQFCPPLLHACAQYGIPVARFEYQFRFHDHDVATEGFMQALCKIQTLQAIKLNVDNANGILIHLAHKHSATAQRERDRDGNMDEDEDEKECLRCNLRELELISHVSRPFGEEHAHAIISCRRLSQLEIVRLGYVRGASSLNFLTQLPRLKQLRFDVGPLPTEPEPDHPTIQHTIHALTHCQQLTTLDFTHHDLTSQWMGQMLQSLPLLTSLTVTVGAAFDSLCCFSLHSHSRRRLRELELRIRFASGHRPDEPDSQSHSHAPVPMCDIRHLCHLDALRRLHIGESVLRMSGEDVERANEMARLECGSIMEGSNVGRQGSVINNARKARVQKVLRRSFRKVFQQRCDEWEHELYRCLPFLQQVLFQ